MNGGKIRGAQLLAHPFPIAGLVTLGELAGGRCQLGRPEVRRRRIDPVARHVQRLGRERDEAQIGIRRRLDGRRALRLDRPVALEPVRPVGKSQTQLRRLGAAPGLRQSKAARRQPLRKPRRVPQRQLALAFAQTADGQAQRAGGIRHQHDPMLFGLEILLAQPGRDGRCLARPPGIDFIFVQQPQRNGACLRRS